MIRRHPLLIKEKSAVGDGRICKFRLPMGENSFKMIFYENQYLLPSAGKESQHRVTYFPGVAFNLFFLRLISLLIHILLVGLLSVLFVCFTFFLLLFSNKMKSSFLFYDFNRAH